MSRLDEQAEVLLSKKSNPRDFTPLPAELASLVCRIRYFLLVWTVKITIAAQLAYLRLIHPSPSKTRPDIVKSYSCRPSLPVRVFMPESRRESAEAQDSLPLYISIHGGAFATCDASIDDSFCRSWCERTGMIVVGLNYRKAPLHRFPIPVLDIAAVARAVIDDETLNIDKSRVVLAGFSAGGKLALTSCQLPELQGRITAAISYFPIVDWSALPHAKWAERLYTEKASESLNTAGPALDWAYVPAGQDRKAKLLSPCYAEREELPPWVCLIGAQHDMLCRESRDMIYSLAGEDVPETGWDQGWERGTYKWILAMGVRHDFTDDLRKKRGQGAKKRKEVCEEVYASVHKWLETKVFAPESKL